ELDINDPSAGWSTPVQLSAGTSAAVGRGTRVDANNTMHVFFTPLPGGQPGLIFHTFKTTTSTTWSTPTAPCTPSSSGCLPFEQALPANFHQAAGRRLFVFFQQLPATPGGRQLFSAELDIDNLTAGWSSSQQISNTIQHVLGQGFTVDANNTVHAFFAENIPAPPAPPPGRNLELFHSFKTSGAAQWSAPRVISDAASVFGVGLALPPNAIQIAGNRLHVLFLEEMNGALEQLWGTSADINNLSTGWSPPERISTGINAVAGRTTVRDSNNPLHAFYTPLLNAPPFTYTLDLYHSFRTTTATTWSTPVQISNAISPPGASIASIPANFSQEIGPNLHVFFQQVPLSGGVQQVYETVLNIDNLQAGWS